MNHFHSYKKLLFIAFSYCLMAQGSALYTPDTFPGNIKSYRIDSVAATLSDANGFSGHITAEVVSREFAPTLPQKAASAGLIRLLPGQSIVFKPGTRIVSGGYLHVMIVPDGGKQGKPVSGYRKKHKVATLDKPSEQPVILAGTENDNSPFSKKTGRTVHQHDNNDETLNALISETSGVSPEQDRKQGGYCITLMGFTQNPVAVLYNYRCEFLHSKHETVTVLRL